MNKFLKIYVALLLFVDFLLLMFVVFSQELDTSEPQAAVTSPPTVFLIVGDANKNTSATTTYFSSGEKIPVQVRLKIEADAVVNNFRSFDLKLQYDKRYLELDPTEPITNIPGNLITTSTDTSCAGITTNHACLQKAFSYPGAGTFGTDTLVAQVNFKVKQTTARVVTDILASNTTNNGIQFFSQADSTARGIVAVAASTNSTVKVGTENWCLGDYNRTVTATKIVDLSDLSFFARYYTPPNINNFSTIKTENGKLKMNVNRNIRTTGAYMGSNWRESTSFTSEAIIGDITSDGASGNSMIETVFRTIKPDPGTNADTVKSIQIGKIIAADGSVKLRYYYFKIGTVVELKEETIAGLTATTPLYVKIEYTHPNVKVSYKLSESASYTLYKTITNVFVTGYTYKWLVRPATVNFETFPNVTAYFDDFKLTSPAGNFTDDFSASTLNQEPTGWGSLSIDAEGKQKEWIGDYDLTNADGKREINLQDLTLFAANYSKTTCEKFRSDYLLN